MKKRSRLFWMIFCSILVTVSVFLGNRIGTRSFIPAVSYAQDGPIIVIDAGHGGLDSGAVGVNGALEKQINLSIAGKLQSILRLFGYRTVMTRSEDISTHDADADTVKSQKTSDLKNRLSLLEQTPGGILISIHQNIYSQPSAKGTQVFYGPSREESRVLAQYLQKTVSGYLQPDNHREIKKASDNLYILFHASKPAVMVECGFLSNPEEEVLLADDTYQEKMAFSIAMGLINTIASEENEKG